MATGIVKWFSDAKGYGFIQPDDAGNDVFAHFSAIEMDGFETLKPGVRVQYELHDGPKGVHALQIVPVDAKPALNGIAMPQEDAPLLQDSAPTPQDVLHF